MSRTLPPVPVSLEPGPAWELARLFPNQGGWDEADFLILNRITNSPIELVDGRLEVLEMPTRSHQRRALEVCNALNEFCKRTGVPGEAVLAAYPLRVVEGRFREPDVLFVLDADRLGEDFADHADLVVEVVSQDRVRDLVHKRRDYAAAAIPEYWIIDPEQQTLTVLRLDLGQYIEHARYGPGHRAASVVLPGFDIDTTPLLT